MCQLKDEDRAMYDPPALARQNLQPGLSPAEEAAIAHERPFSHKRAKMAWRATSPRSTGSGQAGGIHRNSSRQHGKSVSTRGGKRLTRDRQQDSGFLGDAVNWVRALRKIMPKP